MRDIQERIESLTEDIVRWNNEYYNLNKPSVSDLVYDEAFRELQRLEIEYPEYKKEDSPTGKVGSEVNSKLPKVKHVVPMLSLDNSMNEEELRSFDKRVRKVIGMPYRYSVELKIDGLAVSLRYKEGKFEIGATRGDKYEGEDITGNLKTLSSVPLEVDYGIDFEVRGEVYMPESSFERLNKEREEKGLDLFANARNAASGSLRMLDVEETRKRDLELFVYSVISEDLGNEYHSEDLEFMKKLGFKVNPYSKVVDNIEDVIEYIEYIKSIREDLTYGIDGIVIKVDSYKDQNNLGYSSRAPKWATAYKFPAVEIKTELEDILITVGRTGTLTPNAVLKAVNLEGSVVKRASLHNMDYIKDKDIRIGDEVIIRKAGDIIPEVVRVVDKDKKNRNEKYEFNGKCPSCGSEAVRLREAKATKCVNMNCEAQLKEKIVYFASKKAMNIDGLGDKLVNQLFEENMINKFSDMYRLKKEDLIDLDRMGDKKADNLLKAIEGSKHNDPERLLVGFGIHLVGERASKQIMEEFKDINKLLDVDREDLLKVDIVGEKMADSVLEFFSKEETKLLLQELNELGLNMVKKEDNDSDKRDVAESEFFVGKIFVVTGKMVNSGMTRDDVKKKVEDLGGKVGSSVSKNTDVLIAGEKAGSKLKKATDLGIDIWNEEEFLNKI